MFPEREGCRKPLSSSVPVSGTETGVRDVFDSKVRTDSEVNTLDAESSRIRLRSRPGVRWIAPCPLFGNGKIEKTHNPETPGSRRPPSVPRLRLFRETATEP